MSSEQTHNNSESFKNPSQIKIVYWGPGESGKTTNFEFLMKVYENKKISQGFQIETTDKRTLWSDSCYFNFDIKMGDMALNYIVQLATVTGQERFLQTREYALGGADGIIFVADANPEKKEHNLRSFEELQAFIEGRNIPYLIQLNKLDLNDAINVDDFRDLFDLPEDIEGEPKFVYPATARRGKGVIETFADLFILILSSKAR